MKNYKGLLSCILILLALVLAACGVQSEPEVNTVLPENLGQAEVRLPGFDKPQKVTYEIVDGKAMFEGDIILGNVDSKGNLIKSESSIDSQGIGTDTGCWFLGLSDCHWRWANGVIPFVISGNWDDPSTPLNETTTMRNSIMSAINHWQTQTPIRFIARTTQADFVDFASGAGCSSWVGRGGGGRQEIMLQRNAKGVCDFGAIVHEIGHAVGLYHEQSREDRNNKVRIITANIEQGKEHNFNQFVSTSFDIGSYDYKSIMHYGAFDFCKKNSNGSCVGPTIETIPAGIPIGQRTGLSFHDIGAVNRMYPSNNGTFNVTNGQVPNFASWAAASYAKLIPGDFNGDKKQDFALIRKSGGFNDIPVALSNGNGTFTVSSFQSPDFASWASGFAVQIIPGLYNNDSCTDLALVNGASGWASIPVAFSNCNGTFSVTNAQVANFPAWAADITVRIIAGDFDNDKRTDLALVRQSAGWTTVPIAFSNGNGTFKVTNGQVPNFASWAADLNVKVIEGDFNGDKRTDLALVRQAAGWASVPIAFSNGDGSFNVTNQTVANFPAWAADASVKIIPGDFNGDGKQDMTLVRRGAGWKTTPIAFSTGDGKFEVENEASTFLTGLSLSFLADLLASTSVQIVPGDYNGDKRTDLALVNRSAGWNTIPVAFSNADGSFNVTNQQVPNFPSWATTSGVQVIGGDFNADGKSDLSLVLKAAGWTSLPIAFKN